MFHNFNRDINYILKRVIIGVLIALVLGFLGTRKVQALDTVSFNTWQFVYRDNTVGQSWNNSFIYRLGEQKSLLAVNVYWPSFQGYYNGTLTIQFDPAQFPNGSLKLTNQYFKLFVYQNGSYSQQYYIGTCDGDLTCTFNFQGTAEQLSSNNFSVQLLINNDAFSTAYIYYPAARISASVYVSNESNNSNNDIINNQNENTQNIINNQNENTEKEIESQKVCELIDRADISDLGHYLNGSGSIQNNGNMGITDFINIYNSEITVVSRYNDSYSALCFYNDNKEKISCIVNNTLTNNQIITIPSNAKYLKVSIQKNNNVPILSICKNGNQALNDTINDDNVDSSTGTNFFSNFSSDSHGLSGIVSAPLRLINSLSSATCTPLVLPLPFMEQNATLPCMSTVYSQFPTFYSLWQLITSGLIGYWVVIKIFGKVHEFQDPNVDKVEVLDL